MKSHVSEITKEVKSERINFPSERLTLGQILKGIDRTTGEESEFHITDQCMQRVSDFIENVVAAENYLYRNVRAKSKGEKTDCEGTPIDRVIGDSKREVMDLYVKYGVTRTKAEAKQLVDGLVEQINNKEKGRR